MKLYDKNKFGKIKREFIFEKDYVLIIENNEESIIYYEDIKFISLLEDKKTFQIKIEYARKGNNLFSTIINDVNSPTIAIEEILKIINQNKTKFLPTSISYI